ncbi:MAG: DUF1837 domain-containing protein [Clostridiales bacterium]|nr:DUF1837 domain-containing protein [Clostridiales bacterium]
MADAALGVTWSTDHVCAKWLDSSVTEAGKHSLVLLVERDAARDAILGDLSELVREHYVAPETLARRLEEHGATQTAALVRAQLPTGKRSRSGDMGEILATELAEQTLGFSVPVRRLRWKDGREMALRGDDIIGVAGSLDALVFLKGESKSRASLATAAIDEAAAALERDRGRPTRHSVLFVADRLREQGRHDIAAGLESAVINGFKGCRVEHLLFVLSGNNPGNLLAAHLAACATHTKRHAVGLRVADHSAFISTVYGAL